jgi:tRNA C32,U32 (ribose-2'-O)-methylase TrmJ
VIITNAVGANLAVALIRPKYPHNVGAATPAASCYGVPQVWFTGKRVSLTGGKPHEVITSQRATPRIQRQPSPAVTHRTTS